MRKVSILASLLFVFFLATSSVVAQQGRPKSPRGAAHTQVGSGFDQWIEVDYGRPILRGRQGIFGSGETYGQTVNAGAPVWRAGANPSTRLKTEVDLRFGDTLLAAGEYSLFIDLESPSEWTFIVSNHRAQQVFDRNDKTAIWGAYGYDSDQDVLRVPMQVEALDVSVDELIWFFDSIGAEGGRLTIAWDDVIASVSFAVLGSSQKE